MGHTWPHCKTCKTCTQLLIKPALAALHDNSLMQICDGAACYLQEASAVWPPCKTCNPGFTICRKLMGHKATVQDLQDVHPTVYQNLQKLLAEGNVSELGLVFQVSCYVVHCKSTMTAAGMYTGCMLSVLLSDE